MDVMMRSNTKNMMDALHSLGILLTTTINCHDQEFWVCPMHRLLSQLKAIHPIKTTELHVRNIIIYQIGEAKDSPVSKDCVPYTYIYMDEGTESTRSIETIKWNARTPQNQGNTADAFTHVTLFAGK